MGDHNHFPPVLIEVKTAKGKKVVDITDITYIKGARKHCKIYFASKKPMLEVHNMLKWFREKLPESQFYRCHNSYHVNFQYFDCINGNNIILEDNTIIPISSKKKVDCLEMFKRFLSGEDNKEDKPQS